MKQKIIQHAMWLVISMIMLAACNNASNESKDETTETKQAQAIIESVFSDTIVNGTADFMQAANGNVSLTLQLSIPAKANSSIAVHIHENAGCGDSAKAAGGHWNPTNENHGKWGQGQFHSGDIGNLQLDAEGRGSLTMETDRWSIGGDNSKNILDKTIIVHGGTDDYTSQPAGNAGTRIGCGTIKEKGGL